MTGAKDANDDVTTSVAIDKDEAIKEMRLLIEDAQFSGYHMRTDDSYLSRYLHCTSWDAALAAQRALKFCRLKSEQPGYFCQEGTQLEEFRDLLDRRVKFVPGFEDKEGRPVYVIRIGRVDPSRTDCATVNRLDDLWIESILDNEQTQSKGVCVLMDIADYSLRLFTWLTPHNVRMSSLKMETGPVKQIRMHVVNSSRLMNAAIAIAYPLLSDKIKQNIHFHYSNWSSLHKYIDAGLLPPEYGGSGPAFDFDAIHQKLWAAQDRIKENFKWGYQKAQRE